MKCIDARQGSVCVKGWFGKYVKQQNEPTTFRLKDIKAVLTAYASQQEWPVDTFYGSLKDRSRDDFPYRVYFNRKGVIYDNGKSLDAAISIGCRKYTKEDVEKAIKTFLN